MRRTPTAIAAFTFGLAVSATAFAADAPGPYKLDAKGKCHAANGQLAKQTLCSASAPAKTLSVHCKDPKTKKFTRCTAPGAVPA